MRDMHFLTQAGSSDDKLSLGASPDDGGYVQLRIASHLAASEFAGGEGQEGMVEIGGRAVLDAETTDRLILELQRARREAFGAPPCTASVVEIVEVAEPRSYEGTGGLMIPTDVRINGVSVFTTDGGVKIHEIDLANRDLAMVTVTLPVRRITVRAEGDLDGSG